MPWPMMKPIAAPMATPIRIRLYWQESPPPQQLPPDFLHGQPTHAQLGPHVHLPPLAQPQPPALAAH